MTGQDRSSFCHIIIPAPDLEKARSFYEQVFAWRVQPNVPGARYWFFESGNVGGAFNADAQPSPQGVVPVLRVDDMEAAIRRIREHGGTVTREPDLIGKADPGRDAWFTDPNGNAMGIYCRE